MEIRRQGVWTIGESVMVTDALHFHELGANGLHPCVIVWRCEQTLLSNKIYLRHTQAASVVSFLW
jgi:hypothetical protein